MNCVENNLPLQYYSAYRKALRDLKSAIEKEGDSFKHYGMNNWRGMVAVIDIVLKDPEKLMYSASLTGYEVRNRIWQNSGSGKESKKKNWRR